MLFRSFLVKPVNSTKDLTFFVFSPTQNSLLIFQNLLDRMIELCNFDSGGCICSLF